jgi:hypothetical protein
VYEQRAGPLPLAGALKLLDCGEVDRPQDAVDGVKAAETSRTFSLSIR